MGQIEKQSIMPSIQALKPPSELWCKFHGDNGEKQICLTRVPVEFRILEPEGSGEDQRCVLRPVLFSLLFECIDEPCLGLITFTVARFPPYL